jgi:hypothetical protein
MVLHLREWRFCNEYVRHVVGGLRTHKQLMWLLLRKEMQGVDEFHEMFWQDARRKTRHAFGVCGQDPCPL